MTTYMHDLNPVQHLIADAVGEPGKRTFYLQARARSSTVSLVMEKQEVNSLALSVLQLLEELENQYPDLPPASSRQSAGALETPIEPSFRVGELSIGYDEDEDMIWLIAKALVINEQGNIVDPEEESVPAVRLVASRAIMRAMSEHALEVIADRSGHFCPRSDGHAVPVIF
jgi:uncharacterized repeat protein (TIGR03847 family)